MPKVIQVIEHWTCRGKGTEKNPNRTVREFYSLEGEFLADYDPESEKAKRDEK